MRFLRKAPITAMSLMLFPTRARSRFAPGRSGGIRVASEFSPAGECAAPERRERERRPSSQPLAQSGCERDLESTVRFSPSHPSDFPRVGNRLELTRREADLTRRFFVDRKFIGRIPRGSNVPTTTMDDCFCRLSTVSGTASPRTRNVARFERRTGAPRPCEIITDNRDNTLRVR